MNKILSNTSLQSNLNYIGIIESNNHRMIAGTETYTNYESKEVTKAMHIIIYNVTTKEIIYSTGNNLRLSIDNLLQFADDIMTVLNKYIEDNFYLNKFMDMAFYDCNFNNIALTAKQIRKEIQEQQNNIKREETAKERGQLENKLKDICKNKGILLLNNMYIEFVLVHSKELAEKQNSDTFKKMVLDIIETNTISNYKEFDGVKIERLEYTNGNMLDANIEAIELLNRHIKTVETY